MADPNIQNILTDPVMRQVMHPALYGQSCPSLMTCGIDIPRSLQANAF